MLKNNQCVSLATILITFTLRILASTFPENSFLWSPTANDRRSLIQTNGPVVEENRADRRQVRVRRELKVLIKQQGGDPIANTAIFARRWIIKKRSPRPAKGNSGGGGKGNSGGGGKGGQGNRQPAKAPSKQQPAKTPPTKKQPGKTPPTKKQPGKTPPTTQQPAKNPGTKLASFSTVPGGKPGTSAALLSVGSAGGGDKGNKGIPKTGKAGAAELKKQVDKVTKGLASIKTETNAQIARQVEKILAIEKAEDGARSAILRGDKNDPTVLKSIASVQENGPKLIQGLKDLKALAENPNTPRNQINAALDNVNRLREPLLKANGDLIKEGETSTG